MELSPSSSMALICRKIQLLGLASAVMLPKIHRILRRISRLQRRLGASPQTDRDNPAAAEHHR